MMILAFDQQQRGSPLSQEKMWGSEPFWGLPYDWDPDWMLTDRHKELRATAGPGGRGRGQGADPEVTRR